MKRLAALQDWPVLSSRASAAACAAPSTSSVPSRMNGSEPPSSSTTFFRLRPAISDDGAAGALGAGDRDAVHPRVCDHPLDLLVTGVDVLVGALGKTGVVEDLLHRRGRFRALRRVLEQDRVADHQVRPGEAGDLVVGEVPGHDPEEHPVGAAADHRAALAAEQFDRLIGHQVLGVVGVEAVDFRREVDLHQGLLDRLAHLADDDFGQLPAALGVQFADLAHQRGAIGDRGGARPAPGGLIATVDRAAELVVADLRVLLDRFAGGGIDNRVSAHLRPPYGCCKDRSRSSASSTATYSIPTPAATAGWVTSPAATLTPSRRPGSRRIASSTPWSASAIAYGSVALVSA